MIKRIYFKNITSNANIYLGKHFSKKWKFFGNFLDLEIFFEFQKHHYVKELP